MVLASTVGSLVVIVTGCYALMTQTEFGRERVRRLLVPQLAHLLEGELHLQEITELGLTRVALRGIDLLDPEGHLVLRIDQLSARIAPLALLQRRVLLKHVTLVGGKVDLADLGTRRGLLAAATPQSRAPDANTSTDTASGDGGGFAIEVTRFEIFNTYASVTPADVGRMGVREVRATGRFAMRQAARVEIETLTGVLVRAHEDVGQIERLEGRLASHGAPTHLQLNARLGASHLSLDATGHLPSDPRFDASPVALTARMEAVDAAVLSLFDQGKVSNGLKIPIDLKLELAGTGAAARGTFSLVSGAGRLDGAGQLSREGQAEINVYTRGLTPGDIHERGPAGRIALSLRGTADLDLRASGTVGAVDVWKLPITIELSGASWNGAPLPRVSGRATLDDEWVRAVQVSAEGYGGRLELSGEASFNGEARGELKLSLPALSKIPQAFRAPLGVRTEGSLVVDSHFEMGGESLRTRGRLRSRALHLTGLSVGALNATFSAHGQLRAPRLTAHVRGKRLRVGQASLDRLELNANGGPDHYRLAVRAAFPHGDLRAKATARRRRSAVELDLRARGHVLGEPFVLTLTRARVGSSGTLDLPQLRARALDQTLTLSGAYERGALRDVTLLADGIDLARASAALALSPPLTGTAAVELLARGQLDVPNVRVRVRGTGLGVRDRPKLDLSLRGTLDASTGQGALSARLRSGGRLDVTAIGKAGFPRGRVPWSRRLERARLDAELSLDRFDSQLVEALLPSMTLPTRAAMFGRLEAHGTLREPGVSGHVRVQLPDLSPGRSVELRTELSYAEGSGRVRATLSDPDGTWVDAAASVRHPGGSTSAVLTDANRLLHEAAFDGQIQVAPRPIGALPLAAKLLPAQVAGATIAAQVTASHAPRQEPDIKLQLAMTHAPGTAGPGTPPARTTARAGPQDNCMAIPATAKLLAHLRAGELSISTEVTRDSKPVLSVAAGAHLVVSDALANKGAPKPARARAELAFDQVDLASLPYLCDFVHGRLSGNARAHDLFAASPRIDAKLQVAGFGLDPRQRVDVNLDARLERPESRIGLVLRHGDRGDRTSSLYARVPVTAERGRLSLPKDAKLRVRIQLDQLPLGAFVPPKKTISRVSGTLSGRLHATGPLDALDVQGYLEPKDVGFTATPIAQPLSGISGRIRLGAPHLKIEQLIARDGEGTLTARGRLSRRSNGTYTSRVSLSAEEFPLRQQGQIAGVLDTEASVGGTVGERHAQLDVGLGRTSVWLRGGELRRGIDLDPHPDIIDPRAAQVVYAPPAEPSTPLALSLTLTSRDTFWVRRDDFAVRLSLDLAAKTARGNSRIEGVVDLQRGYLQLLGQTFDLHEGSKISFVESSPPDPVLDIRAGTTNRKSGKRISVYIKGRARAPVLQFRLEGDAVTAGEAAHELFGGGEDSASASGQVRSFVGGVIGGIMAVSARRELGELMPLLMVEPGDSTSGARVRAGFELDSLVPGFLQGLIRGVYVEGIIASGDERRQQDTQGGVLLELFFPHGLVTVGQYGPGETWSVDLGWQP